MQELLNLVNGLRAGSMNFKEFIGNLGQWFNDIGVGGPVTSFMAASWFPYVALAVGALFLFYGKKWLGFMLFASCAGIGFVVGLVVSPMLETTLPFLVGKAWITGALCALMLAVLHKLIFGLIFFGGPAGAAFAVCYFPGILPFDVPFAGDLPVCIGVGVGAALIMLIFRKDFQRIITAIIGGIIVNLGVKKLYNYLALVPDAYSKYLTYINIGAIALLALLGYVYQHKRRRRY